MSWKIHLYHIGTKRKHQWEFRFFFFIFNNFFFRVVKPLYNNKQCTVNYSKTWYYYHCNLKQRLMRIKVFNLHEDDFLYGICSYIIILCYRFKVHCFLVIDGAVIKKFCGFSQWLEKTC